MIALNNAQPPTEGEHTSPPHRDGPASNAIPDAQSMPTGVSVCHTQSKTPTSATTTSTASTDKDMHWYVLRVTYGRAIKAEGLLNKYCITTYNPLRRTYKMVKGKRCRVQLPLLPGLIFAHATPQSIASVMKEAGVRALVNYYYDHFRYTKSGYNPPLIVPDRSMDSFIIATTAKSRDVRIVNPSHVHYKSGDIVRVTAGEFQGVEGRVARAAGQQRVIIEIQGVCLIATAYVPTGCIEIISTAK